MPQGLSSTDLRWSSIVILITLPFLNTCFLYPWPSCGIFKSLSLCAFLRVANSFQKKRFHFAHIILDVAKSGHASSPLVFFLRNFIFQISYFIALKFPLAEVGEMVQWLEHLWLLEQTWVWFAAWWHPVIHNYTIACRQRIRPHKINQTAVLLPLKLWWQMQCSVSLCHFLTDDLVYNTWFLTSVWDLITLSFPSIFPPTFLS